MQNQSEAAAEARNNVVQFTWLSRILHWLMAAMVLAMLFIGVGMVSSLMNYQLLVSIHRPLGIAIFLLIFVRFLNRQINPPPNFPPTMSHVERLMASWTERLMYLLMFALPLIGWGMLSAERFPIVLFGPLHLPPILPHSTATFVILRKAHTVLAYLFFFAFMGHLSAVLFHTLVIRDGVLSRMVPWNISPRQTIADD